MARTVRVRMGIVWVLAAAYLFVGAESPPVRAPEQWTQFRLEGGNNVALDGSLSTSWKIVTGGGFSSSPTVADGVLYADDNQGLLSAVDVQTGKTLWRYRAGNSLMSAPLIYKGLVIVGEGDENSPQGSSPSHPIRVGNPPSALIALNCRTGRLAWTLALAGSGMPTPAIVGGVLVHHNGAGHVLGLDPASGRVLYDRNLRSIASMVAALPMPGGRFITAGVDPNAVWMLRARDGSVVWKSTFSSVASGLGDCPPVTDGARIYCDYATPPTLATAMQTERSAKFRAYALDARTGRKLWDTVLESGVLPKRNEAAIPLLADGTLYVGSSVAAVVHALDPATGKVKWTVRTRGPVKGGIAYAKGTLYFGDLEGYLWAVDAGTGAVRGTRGMRTPFNVGSPIIAGKTLIVGSRGGTLAAVPLSSINGERLATKR